MIDPDSLSGPAVAAAEIPRPFPNCYWVVQGRFLAGEYPRNVDERSSLDKIRALLDGGVSSFIDLTESGEGLAPYAPLIGKRRHMRFPIRDGSVPAGIAQAREVLDHIDEEVASGSCVYVHCWGGIGRTGVIVGCWLARHGGGGDDGLQRLQSLWRTCPKSAHRASPETAEQAAFIRRWRQHG